jgi:hypothetical protein
MNIVRINVDSCNCCIASVRKVGKISGHPAASAAPVEDVCEVAVAPVEYSPQGQIEFDIGRISFEAKRNFIIATVRPFSPSRIGKRAHPLISTESPRTSTKSTAQGSIPIIDRNRAA